MDIWRIITLEGTDLTQMEETAVLLQAAFSDIPGVWDSLEEARREVREGLGIGRIARILVNGRKRVLGWIGAIRQRQGHVWELHPLAVLPEVQGQGIGRSLVADLEEQVRLAGGLVLHLGTDDHTGATSLSEGDLFPDVLQRLAAIRNLNRHPYEFYLKSGFSITGVLPDANGPGMPDIFMAKRVGDHRDHD